MKATVLRLTGSTVAVAGCMLLSGGVAFAADISTTGPDSTNIIKTENKCESTVNNDTNVDVTNNNPQDAQSGDADANRNTTVDGVSTGNASNSSDVSFVVDVTNSSGSACAPAAPVTSVTPPAPSPSPSSSPVTPTAAPSQPVGGMGAGEVAEVTQVAMPVGGVGAGSGGSAYFAALVSTTLASLTWFAVRVRKQISGFLS